MGFSLERGCQAEKTMAEKNLTDSRCFVKVQMEYIEKKDLEELGEGNPFAPLLALSIPIFSGVHHGCT